MVLLKLQAKEKSYVFISLSATDKRCLEPATNNIKILQQNKKLYNFYTEEIVDSFFDSIKKLIVSAKNGKFKMQEHTQIISVEPTEIVELENLRAWVKKVYFDRYFNNVVRQNMKQDILKCVRIIDETGSSWRIRRFNKIQVNVISRVDAKKLLIN